MRTLTIATAPLLLAIRVDLHTLYSLRNVAIIIITKYSGSPSQSYQCHIIVDDDDHNDDDDDDRISPYGLPRAHA